MLHKDPDALTKQEKIILGLETIKNFFDSLGPTDIYKQLVLEEVMKFIIEGGGNGIHLSTEEKQEGRPDNNPS